MDRNWQIYERSGRNGGAGIDHSKQKGRGRNYCCDTTKKKHGAKKGPSELYNDANRRSDTQQYRLGDVSSTTWHSQMFKDMVTTSYKVTSQFWVPQLCSYQYYHIIHCWAMFSLFGTSCYIILFHTSIGGGGKRFIALIQWIRGWFRSTVFQTPDEWIMQIMTSLKRPDVRLIQTRVVFHGFSYDSDDWCLFLSDICDSNRMLELWSRLVIWIIKEHVQMTLIWIILNSELFKNASNRMINSSGWKRWNWAIRIDVRSTVWFNLREHKKSS